MAKVQPREVPNVIRKLRDFLLGRKHTTSLRNAQDIAKRTQPLPNLPPGPCSKIHDNYYCTRDARGEVDYPRVVAGPQTASTAKKISCTCDDINLRLQAGTEVEKDKQAKSAVQRTPGKVYHWD